MGNRRVLIIGPNFYRYNESVARAFELEGYITKIADYIEVDIPITPNKLINKFLLKIDEAHFVSKYAEQVNKKIIEITKEYKPDAVLVIKGSIVSQSTLEYLKKQSGKLILWMMDSIYNQTDILKTLAMYDSRFMFERTDIDKIKADTGIESNFLPLCYDNFVYFPMNVEKNIDICFVGSFRDYDNRALMLEKLVNELKQYNIAIFGRYTMCSRPQRFINYYLKGYNRYFTNKCLNPQGVNELYNRSKIAINIHHNQSKEGCNPRFFEISGAKTFQIVDSNRYIESNFGDKCSIYGNYEELVDKIKYYLKNNREREKYADIAYNYIAAGNTFRDRIKELILKAGV